MHGQPLEKKAHAFEKHHFRAPRWCDLCKKFIYGLMYQGNKCKNCSYAAHFKCSTKIGKSCYTDAAMAVWKRRDLHDMATASYKQVGSLFLHFVFIFRPRTNFDDLFNTHSTNFDLFLRPLQDEGVEKPALLLLFSNTIEVMFDHVDQNGVSAKGLSKNLEYGASIELDDKLTMSNLRGNIFDMRRTSSLGVVTITLQFLG